MDLLGQPVHRRVLAVRYPLIVGTYFLAATRLPHAWLDYGYLRQGALFLFSGGPNIGLHVYAHLPYLQIGPLSFAAAAGLALGWPFHEHGAATVLGAVLLIATVRCGELAAFTSRGAIDRDKVRTVSLLASPALALGWADTMVNWGHLDDVLALALLAAAWLANRRDRAALTGLLVGLATGAKPWALLGVALMLSCSRANAIRLLGGATAVCLAVWLPFALAAPHTLAALTRFSIGIQPGSLLHGVYGHVPAPRWVRIAQLGTGLLLASLAGRQNRPELILCAGLLLRLMLDPGDFSYYTSELLFGVLLVELYRAPSLSAWRATGIAVYLPWTMLNFDPFVIPASPALGRALVFGGVVLYLAWALAVSPKAHPVRSAYRAVKLATAQRLEARA